MAWPPPGPQWPRLMCSVLSSPSPPSLPLLLFSHPIPSKRSVDSASPNQRPVRRLSGLLSRGRSNLATSLRHKPNWREKSDKSTISPPYTSHLVPTRTRAHALSFFLSFVISISCHLPIPPPSLPLYFAFLSLLPLPPRWTTSNRVSTLIARELGTLIEWAHVRSSSPNRWQKSWFFLVKRNTRALAMYTFVLY